MHELKPMLEIKLINGLRLHIRYNDFGEYSYKLIFSSDDLDRIRFDNYDKDWNVETKPHHYHLRGAEEAMKSPMSGTPSDDLPILISEIEKHKYSCSLTQI